MNIKTENHGWAAWTAIDDDNYDGAPDSHCPVGSGRTAAEAINDLCEQIVEKLEEKIDMLRLENKAIRAENKALLSRMADSCPPDSEINSGPSPEYSEAPRGAQGRMPDEPEERTYQPD